MMSTPLSLPGVSTKLILFVPLNACFPSITAFIFTPDGLSSPSVVWSFLLLGQFFLSCADCWSSLFTALHTHSLPAISSRETPLLLNQELELEGKSSVQLKRCGRWPARGCHGNSWISFIPPLLPHRLYKTEKNKRTLFPSKLPIFFTNANPWHPCCW